MVKPFFEKDATLPKVEQKESKQNIAKYMLWIMMVSIK
jgi:hypothetical protein